MINFKFENLSGHPDYIRDTITNRRYDTNNPPPEIEWLIVKQELNGEIKGVLSRGEFMMVYGPEKSRKSSFMSCILASGYNEDTLINLGFHLRLKPESNILWFDTEMGQKRWYKRNTKLLEMCGFITKDELGNITTSDNIPNYDSFCLRGQTFKEKIKNISFFLEEAHKQNINIDALFIDQMGDLVKEINDTDTVNNLIYHIEKWTSDYDLSIIGTIHSTRDKKHMRGITGSILAQKVDNAFYLEKDGDKTKVNHDLSRDETIKDFYFTHNPDTNLPNLIYEVKEDLPF